MALRPALLLAGRTRFRPILMTSLAAILGLFPLALGIGPGAQMQQPLAIMVIGGLTANMLFTRMVIPVGYLVLERRKDAPAPAPAVPADRPQPRPRCPEAGTARGRSVSGPRNAGPVTPTHSPKRERIDDATYPEHP